MKSILRSAVMVLALGLTGIPVAAAEDGENAQAGVAGALERMASASAEEKQAYAASANQEMSEFVSVGRKLLEAARREGDVETIQCISERLSAMVSLQEVSATAEGQMNAALDAGETERSGHEVRKIAVALEKSRQLSAEAQACAGKSKLSETDTILTWEGGVGSEDDLMNDETDPWWQEPNEVSPFM